MKLRFFRGSYFLLFFVETARTHYVTKTGLESTAIILPQTQKWLDYRLRHWAQLEAGFFFYDLFIFISCSLVLYLHVCLCEGRVTGSCRLPCGYWELNRGPLEEQPVLFNTEPTLQPLEAGCYLTPQKRTLERTTMKHSGNFKFILDRISPVVQDCVQFRASVLQIVGLHQELPHLDYCVFRYGH